jgi:hypothetical protein
MGKRVWVYGERTRTHYTRWVLFFPINRPVGPTICPNPDPNGVFTHWVLGFGYPLPGLPATLLLFSVIFATLSLFLVVRPHLSAPSLLSFFLPAPDPLYSSSAVPAAPSLPVAPLHHAPRPTEQPCLRPPPSGSFTVEPEITRDCWCDPLPPRPAPPTILATIAPCTHAQDPACPLI